MSARRFSIDVGIWLCLLVVLVSCVELVNGAGYGAALLALVALVCAFVLGARSER